MKRAISPAAAAALIPDGAVVMIGGFMGVGSPHRLIDALVAADKEGLTVIANDTGLPGVGIGKLITAGCVSPCRRLAYRPQSRNPEAHAGGRDRSRARAAGHAGRTHPRGRFRSWRRADEDGARHRSRPRASASSRSTGKSWLYAPPLAADFALLAANAPTITAISPTSSPPRTSIRSWPWRAPS